VIWATRCAKSDFPFTLPPKAISLMPALGKWHFAHFLQKLIKMNKSAQEFQKWPKMIFLKIKNIFAKSHFAIAKIIFEIFFAFLAQGCFRTSSSYHNRGPPKTSELECARTFAKTKKYF